MCHFVRLLTIGHQGFDEGGRFGAGLLVFVVGVGVGNDTAADLEIEVVVAGDGGANGDIEIEITGEVEIADRAGIDAAAG